VAHQSLDRDQIHAAFEQVSCKGVAQRVNTAALDDARTVTRSPVGSLGGLDAQSSLTATRAKEPVTSLGLAYVGSQEFQQGRRQQGVAGLGSLTILDPNTHAVRRTVNVSHPQRAGFKHAQPCCVDGLQDHSIHGIGAGGKKARDLFARQQLRLSHRNLGHDVVVAQLLRPLIDQDLSLVFYDLTTIRAAGLSVLEDDVRHYGMAKEGIIARQFMLGVVQTAEGLPIYHEVFDGNQGESPTLMPTLQKVLTRFAHIKRLIVVADRGLLSLDNMDELGKVKLPSGQALEFILAVPGRRYGEFVQTLQDFQRKVADAKEEVIDETTWKTSRLVIAHNPVQALEQTTLRRQRIAQLQAKAQQWAGKLDGQDAGETARGRKLSDSGAKARLYHEVCEAHLARIIKVDLKTELFSYTMDEAAQSQAEMMDGKLLLLTNVTDLKPAEVVARYKALADIERGFRVLKSEIEIAPVYHRLPERIKAHAMLCFMALIVYRVMRQRLKLAKSDLSPERALAQLRRIQRHSVRINGAPPISGVSTINTEQTAVYAALSLKKPTQDAQLSLL
jgi:transposase